MNAKTNQRYALVTVSFTVRMPIDELDDGELLIKAPNFKLDVEGMGEDEFCDCWLDYVDIGDVTYQADYDGDGYIELGDAL